MIGYWIADGALLLEGVLILTLAVRQLRQPAPAARRRPRYPVRSIVVDGVTHPSDTLMALIEKERAGRIDA